MLPGLCAGMWKLSGSIYRYRVTPDQQAHGLIVVQDNDEMLVGTTGRETTAIRTRQPGVVQ